MFRIFEYKKGKEQGKVSKKKKIIELFFKHRKWYLIEQIEVDNRYVALDPSKNKPVANTKTALLGSKCRDYVLVFVTFSVARSSETYTAYDNT